MFQCEVVSIGGTYMDPLSIHTTMTIYSLLCLFRFTCPRGHTTFSLYRLSATDSYWVLWFLCPLWDIRRSPSIVYLLLVFLDPCSMWQMWYNKWHIVSALIFSALHVLLGHSSLSFYRLSVLTRVLSLDSWNFTFMLF